MGIVQNVQYLEKISSDSNPKLRSENITINPSCSSSLSAVQSAALLGKSWALKMIDSDGKLGAGFLQGNTMWIGR